MEFVLVCVPLQRCFCLCCGGLSFFSHFTHGIHRSGRWASKREEMSDLEKPLREKKPKTWVDWAVQFRWILVIFVVLPVSRAFDLWAYLGDIWSASKSEKQRQKEHDENVEKLIKRLKSRDPARDGLVCTARKPWIAVGMRNVDYKRARHFEVDLAPFRQVLYFPLPPLPLSFCLQPSVCLLFLPVERVFFSLCFLISIPIMPVCSVTYMLGARNVCCCSNRMSPKLKEPICSSFYLQSVNW